MARRFLDHFRWLWGLFVTWLICGGRPHLGHHNSIPRGMESSERLEWKKMLVVLHTLKRVCEQESTIGLQEMRRCVELGGH